MSDLALKFRVDTLEEYMKELVTRLSRNGIYAMAMSGSAVDLLNFEDIPR